MFDFSVSPESTLQMIQDARRASPGGGPGVPELPLDEQTLHELRLSLAYSFANADTAQREHSPEVTALAKTEFDKVWLILIDLDDEFKRRVIAGETNVPIGRKKPYQDYARGKTSEL